MLHTKFCGKLARGFWRRRFLKGFYHTWEWWPSWLCDPDAGNKISFPLPKEAPHKIWLCSTKRFWRRRCLKMWTDDDGRMPDAGPLVYYKLTNEPSAQVSYKRAFLIIRGSPNFFKPLLTH